MKKIRFFYITFLLFIAGCTINNTEKIFLSFEDSEKIVSENINFILNENKSIFEYLNYNGKCGFKSDDVNIKLDSNIQFSGFLDQSKNEKLDIFTDTYFFDKKGKQELSVSGDILNLYNENQYYTKLSGFSIDMGKGNYESNLRYMIIENIGEKRIRFNSKKFDNIKKTQNDIKFLLNTISSSSVFENVEQVTYEGYIAYKTTIKEDILNFIKDQTYIEITSFDGLFIIKSDNQVDLKINDMQVVYKNDLGIKNFTINGIIGEDNGILIVSEDEKNVEISYEMHRKYTKISISNSVNFNQMWSFDTNISKTKKEKVNNFNIKGDIKISPIIIYGSNLENDLKIDIRCLYENFSGEIFDLKDPDSYILLEQILGDEFSIKNFIGDK